MRSKWNSRRAWLAGTALAAALAGTAAAEPAEADFAIAAGDLGQALSAYAKQSGVEIFYQTRTVSGRRTAGVNGTYEPRVALAQLIAGTGLVVSEDASGVLVVREAVQDPQGGSAAGGGATVEALIVTAQKREEDIQDVPIAISAFSQEDLTRSQVAGGPDLMTQVPNMTFTKTNFSSYSVQIRGIGTQAISATTDPAVAVAFNNTPFIRNRFFEQEFYDLQRVEVLRGPQGTLYGRNATAGVVNIISAKPKFTYEAKVSADAANYNSTRLEGMINVPLVEDVVALRLAGAWTRREGFVTNELTGNPIDGRNLWSTRLSLRFTPADWLDANLIWEHFEEDDDRLRSGKQLCHKDIVTEVAGVHIPGTPDFYGGRFPGGQSTYYQSQLSQGCIPASLYAPESFETPNGFQFGFYYPLGSVGLPQALSGVDPYVSQTQSRDLRVIESTIDPSYRAKTDVVEFQFEADISDTLSLSSETAWATDFIYSTQDYNRFNTRGGMWEQTNNRPGVLNDGVFCDPQLGCTDRLVLQDLSTARSRHFSQEFRLASNYDGPFNFSVGANFLRYDTHEKYYVFINALSLFGASSFASKIETPYVGGVSDNSECSKYGLQIIDPNNFGGVGTAGHCLYIDPNPISGVNDLGHNYFLSKNPYKLISYAAFGEAYYQVADNLKITAGLRWTVDKKEAPRIPNWVLATNVGYPVLEVVEQEWRKPTGRLAVDWKPDLAFTDETLLYASYARGYKAGGANPPPAGVALNVNTGNDRPDPSDTHPPTFDAEYVDAFELGSKNTLFDGRVTANVAAFYYDYKGYQLSQIVDRSAITKNFDADVWGVEIEADWRPVENFRLGLKLGYEDTKVADGQSAVDVMDRSNGNQLDYLKDEDGGLVLDNNGDPIPFHWIVAKPFPIYPSNCILPDILWTGGGALDYVQQVGNVAGSNNDGCAVAYFQGLDPVTGQPYVTNPPGGPFWSYGGHGGQYPDYPGFFPGSAPNNGEGISKDLSGNELPNAPHWTATLTGDYTVPLAGDWLMTLHSDVYYQSEAWTRIFNTEGYDKLKAYTNVNLAAIFTNEPQGWKVMAYVKNVFDRDSITGAFLNSDDTGLTTNVFLTEPRIYGLRVTKDFQGGPWWTGANPNYGGPFPLTVEVGGQVQRIEAPYETLQPQFTDALPATLDLIAAGQNPDLDWGDSREVKLTYQPSGTPWKASLGLRYGRTNGTGPFLRNEERTDIVCGTEGVTFYGYDFSKYCDPEYLDGRYYNQFNVMETNWSTERSTGNREKYELVDFAVGRDVGMGTLERSTVAFGLRYAHFRSASGIIADAVPDWYVPSGFLYHPYINPYAPFATYTRYHSTIEAEREFEGTGPILSWEAAVRLLGNEGTGRVNADWSLQAGALFGDQTTQVTGVEEVSPHQTHNPGGTQVFPPLSTTTTTIDFRRSGSVTVPLAAVSLGLSYEIQRIKLSTGYRWERYFDVLDAGFDSAKDADRTIDGPYFKIAVGFGG